MGGIFVYVKKIMKLLFGYICGLLFIVWVPIHLPNKLSEIIIEVVLSPVPFIASILAFFIGFLLHADLIKNGIEMMAISMWRGKLLKLECLFLFCVLLSFYLLSIISLWPALAFFCFSCLYGMISLDYELLRESKQ
jgi:hypothetical protein